MRKEAGVAIGRHFEDFIADQIASGRYESANDVIREALRVLEEREIKLAALRRALKDGEESGFVQYSLENLLHELDAQP